ncbi:hypothetical protein HETIRDRAFT_426779 [Heterobasidion irregulare TC 32-1]|uniref:Uncharacterized protein n=1 Tax=Heterobasidion irregulare (strain TC 32-1) TaxID=747525 RepID=W4K694_HETIT|nr:uncharacterized protein HETIRDRAFT_426779 [Heterobasidion irregulare TC 32-1]ETW81313.1 hypothetical protein HETIRDRAFT_426779 [Heterobasidion irregulare TC 32-1]
MDEVVVKRQGSGMHPGHEVPHLLLVCRFMDDGVIVGSLRLADSFGALVDIGDGHMGGKGFIYPEEYCVAEALCVFDGFQRRGWIEARDGQDAVREEHLFCIRFPLYAGNSGGQLEACVNGQEQGVVVGQEPAIGVYGKDSSGCLCNASGNEYKINNGRSAHCLSSMWQDVNMCIEIMQGGAISVIIDIQDI